MQTIKVGMTRADLLKVFEEEGGLHTSFSGHYVLHACPYFKVNVIFEPAVAGASASSPQDLIKTISPRYLQFPIAN